MSKFIGDINLVGTVTIDSDCSVDVSFTEENLKSFGYGDIADYTYAKDASQEVINAAVSAAKHYSWLMLRVLSFLLKWMGNYYG